MTYRLRDNTTKNIEQETQLLLTNRATRLEILTFKTTVTMNAGLGVTEGHWKCPHSIYATSYIDVQ